MAKCKNCHQPQTAALVICRECYKKLTSTMSAKDKQTILLNQIKLLERDNERLTGQLAAMRRDPLADNKALTVEALRERTKPVWCAAPDCAWIPEGGYYCLCEKGMITPPSKQSFSAEDCLENGWQLFDRPPEKGE